MRTDHPALVLFARAPRLGSVKTRLQPDLPPEDALALHRALVQDALGVLRGFAGGQEVHGVVAFSEPLAPDEPLRRELGGLEVTVQEGDDLGERLIRTFQERLHHGAPSVVVIGSDSPTLDADYLRGAFAALADHDIVIGPAEDGGYLLIGCRRLHVRPFQRIPWGTPKVLSETRRRLRREEIPFALLRPGHDLDTREDLVRTYRELEHLEEVGAPQPAPRTLQALREILWSRQDWLQDDG